jgi:hypothetical protein
MPPSVTHRAETTPADARARLLRLQAERLEVTSAGVPPSSVYLRHLDAAITIARKHYAISAVTEIAALRAGLGAPLQG